MIKIVFTEKLFEDLKKGLQWDGKEKMLYALSHISIDGENIKVILNELILPSEKDYVRRSAGYYEVYKLFVSKVFNNGIETQRDVVQVHIHPPFARGRFSPVDEADELKIMRHVAENIKGIYHLSIVVSNDFSEFDSWYYDRTRDELRPVDKIIVVGKDNYQVIIPSRKSQETDEHSLRYDRTVKAFGAKAVRLLKQLDVGVIGASALGGPIIEMLARDNVSSITICDPDIIDETNLNRLPGTTPKNLGQPKAEFYSEYAKSINPDIKVKAFKESFYDLKVQKAFAQTDIMFGCVDSGARFSINKLSLSNLIPYFDLGATILREQNKIVFEGGQVFSIIPGRSVCLECSGVFKNLKHEFWSEDKKNRERKQGYLDDNEVLNPLVAHLDYVIAGLGYHEMLLYVWGQSSGGFKRYCDLANNKLIVADSDSEGCIFCQSQGCLGMGDKVKPLVPAKGEVEDVPVAPATPEKDQEEPPPELASGPGQELEKTQCAQKHTHKEDKDTQKLSVKPIPYLKDIKDLLLIIIQHYWSHK